MRFLSLAFFGLAIVSVACGGSVQDTPGGPQNNGDASIPTPDSGPGTNWHIPAVHRPSPQTCAAHPTGAASGAPPPLLDAGSGACTTDADCTLRGGLTGHCRATSGGAKACDYDECLVDGDCAPGTTCTCDQPSRLTQPSDLNRCLPSNCRVDADCGPGGYCSPTVSSECGPFYGTVGWYCHTKQDECIDDVDCPATDGAKPYCAYQSEVGRWTCDTGYCAG
jgi:hypothetical protein